jgi:hypothetical protein
MPTGCEALLSAKRPRYWPFCRGFPGKGCAPTHSVNRLLSDLWTLPAEKVTKERKIEKAFDGPAFPGYECQRDD